MSPQPPVPSGHLDAHHLALNELLRACREQGEFQLAGQVMQLHPRNAWEEMRALLLRTAESHPAPELRRIALATVEAIDLGPLHPDWIPPEQRT